MTLSFDLFENLMSFDTKGTLCIEIFFRVKDNGKFCRCWMGKMPDKLTKKDLYWFGLTPDGKNAYDYPTFDEFSGDGVFDGNSLAEIWDSVEITEINSCDPQEMIEIYLSGGGLCAAE